MWQDIPDGAIVWVGPIPECPEHKGKMKYNMPNDWYECLGFDGEGCPYVVTMEEAYKNRTVLGTAEPIEFKRKWLDLCHRKNHTTTRA